MAYSPGGNRRGLLDVKAHRGRHVLGSRVDFVYYVVDEAAGELVGSLPQFNLRSGRDAPL